MPPVLHYIEKQIVAALRMDAPQTIESLERSTGLEADQVRRGIEWLRHKGLARTRMSSSDSVRLTERGIESLRQGLPYRRLVDLLRGGPQTMGSLKSRMGSLLGAAMGPARSNGWVGISAGKVSLLKYPEMQPLEKAISAVGGDSIPVKSIQKRILALLVGHQPRLAELESAKKVTVSLEASARSLVLSESEAMDVKASVPDIYVARTHPLKDVMDEVREIFTMLGFTEIDGPVVQSSFWNFDALFTPQDHPAREMQDTFYLDNVNADRVASAGQVRNVSRSHRDNWRYRWRMEEARRMVLRTHTTCVTIQNLAKTRPGEARIFSLGRVFRNEKVSYKHLVEFTQVEGAVVGERVTLRDLMGIQKEFYRRMGITKVKFWPTFFPYTEPSLQTMVYNDRLGKWVELFGMGIFRPEVTGPLGIDRPVLAWGGGIERIAMLRYGLDDIREFYGNRLSWLRSARPCQ